MGGLPSWLKKKVVKPVKKAIKNIGKGASNFWNGTDEVNENVSDLTPEQEKVNAERVQAAAGGFKKSSDYYDEILNGKHDLENIEAEYSPLGKYKPVENNYFNEEYNQNAPGYENFDEDWEAMNAPEYRKYNEEILPNIAEQYAGLGAGGGLGSSSFNRSIARAGNTLNENLAKMKADFRQNTLKRQQEMMNYNDTLKANQNANKSNLDLENARLGLQNEQYNNTNENNLNLQNVNNRNNVNLNNANLKSGAATSLSNQAVGALNPTSSWKTTQQGSPGLKDEIPKIVGGIVGKVAGGALG